MKPREEQTDRIERALRIAHRTRAESEFAPHWRQKVMRDIRRLHNEALEKSAEVLAFKRIILPFASATAIAAGGLLVLTLNGGLGIEYDVLMLMVEDSTGLFSPELLGL